MTRLEHIGLAVSNPAPVAELLSKLLGLQTYKIETVPSERVTTHFLAAGDVKLELLESDDPDSVVGKFLASRGEGIHHIAFEVEDIEVALDRALGIGLTPVGSGFRQGADGKRVFFLHPKETHGILVEICQTDRFPGSTIRIPMPHGSVAAFTAGSPAGPSLLFLHDAGGASLRDFGSLIRRLEPRLRLVAFDAPGHGGSRDWPPQSHFLRAADKHARAVLDHFEIDSVVVVGNGVGAAAAVTLAIHYPDRVRGLILLDPNMLATKEDLEAASHSIEEACAAEMPDLASTLVATLPEAAESAVSVHRTGALSHPVLLCSGRKSALARTLLLHEDLPGSSLAVVPEFHDGAGVLAQIFIRFVDSLPA